jgi:hypothetical protein
LVAIGAAVAIAIGCGSSSKGFSDDVPPVPPGGANPGADPGGFGQGVSGDAGTCVTCSLDGRQVVTCDGKVLKACDPSLRCGGGDCLPPCDAARANRSSVGCDYQAVAMAGLGAAFGGCFVSFVANTFDKPVKLSARWGSQNIDLGRHAKIPRGSGPSLAYDPYDPQVGLAPNQVAILFLANDPVPHGQFPKAVECPFPAAVGLDAHVHWYNNIDTGRSTSFSITSDYPVVAYQMLPYGGGYAASTGATLLLPTSAWDTNYVGVMAYRAADFMGMPLPPTMAVVASQDDTKVTIVPTQNIRQGYGVAGANANQPVTYALKAGEFIEFIQADELTGSAIQSTKPIGLFAGHVGLRVPFDADYSDHAEQQIPPVRALGSEYAAASYRDRIDGAPEGRRWRIVGAVDGTRLTFDPPVSGAPSTLGRGDVRELTSDTPFVVKSQDKDHPFLLFTYMGSSQAPDRPQPGYGDADFVRIVPGLQYLNRYVFFTDPTYPETNLVVVRRRGRGGFADVSLDCAGTLGGWQPVGSGQDYQVTRVDLSRHNFQGQGKCDNGRHEMTSSETFGLWVWGWGGPETRPGQANPCDFNQRDNSCDVSYGYPAGENLAPINAVVVPPVPK